MIHEGSKLYPRNQNDIRGGIKMIPEWIKMVPEGNKMVHQGIKMITQGIKMEAGSLTGAQWYPKGSKSERIKMVP